MVSHDDSSAARTAASTQSSAASRLADALARLEREAVVAAEARDDLTRELAAFLLDMGYGVDFSFQGKRPPVDVLEAMVDLAVNDGFYTHQGDALEDRLEDAYYMLSEELGDWRSES